MAYNYNLVRVANERLRKLERKGLYSGYSKPLANSSVEYQAMRTMAIELPNTKGAIYRLGTNTDMDKYGPDKLRFITKREYMELTPRQQEYFDEQLTRFLEAQTTTKLGIEKAVDDAYNKFLENHSNLSDMTREEYAEFWEEYADRFSQMQADSDSHYGYEGKENSNATSVKDRLDLFLNNATMSDLRSKGGTGIDPTKLDEVFNYVIEDMKTPRISRLRSRNNRKGRRRR